MPAGGTRQPDSIIIMCKHEVQGISVFPCLAKMRSCRWAFDPSSLRRQMARDPLCIRKKGCSGNPEHFLGCTPCLGSCDAAWSHVGGGSSGHFGELQLRRRSLPIPCNLQVG